MRRFTARSSKTVVHPKSRCYMYRPSSWATYRCPGEPSGEFRERAPKDAKWTPPATGSGALAARQEAGRHRRHGLLGQSLVGVFALSFSRTRPHVPRGAVERGAKRRATFLGEG